MSRPHPLLPLLAGLLLAPAGLAQSHEPASGPDLAGGLRRWQAEHGSTWRTRADRGTGAVRLLFGGSLPAGRSVRTDADFLALARERVAEAHELLGIQTATLRDERALFLPLALEGSSDKVTVRLLQEVNGVPVEDGTVNALFSADGDLLAIDSKALPGVAGMDTQPTLDAAGALRFATETFRKEVGMAPSAAGQPELVIVRETVDKQAQPRLAWRLDLTFRGVAFDVVSYRYFVAAQGAPRVIERQDRVHQLDVGGQVVSFATPGVLPDIPSNPETAVPMAYMTVTSPAGTTTTDANGNFNFPGVSGPLNVTVTYDGLYNDVLHDTDVEYSLTVPLTGTGNVVTMNPAPNEDVTAQANAFYRINSMRDWTRAVNPADAMMDFVNRAVVMIEFRDFGSFSVSNCNAVFVGNETNYWYEAGGCVNTAYATVIHHEQGHWQNVRYGSGNGGDGFGEGNADVYAMYQGDSPIVGEMFAGNGFIRTGNNTRQYCGDGNGGCYGGVHTDGEVLMGAFWKMRVELDAALGNAAGDALADALFLGWMNAFDQGTIDSIIVEQLLTLDDNDGNINNGTPHGAQIDAGFVAQGFPSFVPDFVGFTNVIAAPNTLDEAGPYGVAADVTALVNPSISGTSVFYRVNGGAYTELPMADGTGAQWTALLPGVTSPAQVDYYFEGTDGLGNSQVWPETGTLSFKVGELVNFYEDDFETAGDNGWTHFQIATQDDWQHDVPNGSSGSSSGVPWSDPSSAFSGTRVWGNDLGPSGFNGAYQPNVINRLVSPSIDLSGAVGATLSFQRWLTVEEAIFDQAEIRVNGTTLWTNPLNGHTLDTSWTPFDLDISSVADGNPNVQVEFRLTTDGGLQLGGWNIDDVCVATLSSSPTAGLPTLYGSGLAGTNGVPAIDTRGQPAVIGNPDHVVAIKNGPPGATAYLFEGPAPTAAFINLLQTELLVLPEVGFVLPLDVFGQGTMPLPVPAIPAFVGLSFYFQGFVTDGAAPGPFSATRGLQVTVVDAP